MGCGFSCHRNYLLFCSVACLVFQKTCRRSICQAAHSNFFSQLRRMAPRIPLLVQFLYLFSSTWYIRFPLVRSDKFSEMVLTRMALLMGQSRSVLPLRSAKAQELGELWREKCMRTPWAFPFKLARTELFSAGYN